MTRDILYNSKVAKDGRGQQYAIYIPGETKQTAGNQRIITKLCSIIGERLLQKLQQLINSYN
jgi:hypothetical protein